MKQRHLIFAMGAAGLSLLAFSAAYQGAPRLLYNPTESAPKGWYAVSSGVDYTRGDRVAAHLPHPFSELAYERAYLPAGAPVIKTIGAVAGDRYCVTGRSLELADGSVLPLKPSDSQGRAMPALAGGCRRVSDGHVLIVSDYSARSFDSRYVGEVPVTAILGKVWKIGFAEETMTRIRLEGGGARGQGAQGKIKGGGPQRGLTPCLYIDFYGPLSEGLGLRIWESSMNTELYWGPISHVFTMRHGGRKLR